MDQRHSPSPRDLVPQATDPEALEQTVLALLEQADAEPEQEVAMLQQAHALLHKALQ